MKQGLQLVTQSKLVSLTSSQKGLLGLITDAVSKGVVVTMDDLVKCYCRVVRSNYYHPWENDKEYSVYAEFKKQSHVWTYRLRGLIKSWFVNTIGVLVIKGKLIVLPVIEIEE